MNVPPEQPHTFGAGLLHNIEARELGQARAILVVMGLIAMVSSGLTYSALRHFALTDSERVFALSGIAVGAVYLACAFAVSRKPLAATGIGLAVFIGTQVLQAVLEPGLFFDIISIGFGMRVVIFLGLASAVQFARVYERNLRARAVFPTATVVTGR